MLKNLLVNLPIGATENAAAEYAISMAREFDAHLTAIAFAYEAAPITMAADNISPELIDKLYREAERLAKGAATNFEEVIRGSGVSSDVRWMSASFAGTGELFGRIARRFDLSIVRQAEPDKNTPDSLIIEGAMFDSGRPVLVLPYIAKDGFKFERILVCWDGSRSAARALGDSLPFLKLATMVEVAVVGDKPKSKEIPGADIANSLARHGVNVEVKEIVASDMDVANVILSHGADFAADFMVMGGYGHSRFREFVLGGVTRSILASMTIPTLMSH
jgi:nucleotide-binding universal stress UspA family protein